MERPEKKTRLGLHILKLPPHILCDIMLKLPASSIIRCCCVCTTFRNLVTDSTFQKLYLSQALTSCVVLSGGNGMQQQCLSCIESYALTETSPSSNHGSSCMASLRKQSYSSKCLSRTDPIHKSTDGLQLINRTRFITFQTKTSMHLVNSSNGILCLRSSRIDFHSYSIDFQSYHICNPLLGEIIKVSPSPSAAVIPDIRFSAFGFDPKSKHYKILQLTYESNEMVAELYQSGDDTWRWRVIENAPTVRPDSAFDPSLNGALHWVTFSPHVSELICSFDLHSNEFKWLAPPSHFDDSYLLKVSSISVGVLKGSLCLCYVVGGVQFEAWVMEKYGVEESWTKVFTIDINSYCGLSFQDKHRPIGFSSSGDMWLKDASDSDSHCLVSYSAEAGGGFRLIDIGGISPIIEAIPHVFSFVSLKDTVNIKDTHLEINKLTPN